MPLVFDHRLDTKRTALFLAAIIESESVHHIVNESVRMKRISGADGVKKQLRNCLLSPVTKLKDAIL